MTLAHPDRLSKGRQDAPPRHRQVDCTKHLKKKLVCYGGEKKISRDTILFARVQTITSGRPLLVTPKTPEVTMGRI